MHKKQRNFCAGVFVVMFLLLSAPLRSQAAWAKNPDGTYSYYKANGQKITKQWVKTGGEFYYFNQNGIMVTDRQIGQYYVGADGKRLRNTWLDDRYLDDAGKVSKGLHKINGTYYYFERSSGRMVTSQDVTVDGVTYRFGKKGKGTIVTQEKAPAASVNVHDTYYSDPYVDDETLLAAIIYCEAGNQAYSGQLAVGYVIMNRVNASGFPNKIREVIYAYKQFEPARNGALTKALKNPSIVTTQCRKAAKETLSVYKGYAGGKKVYLKVRKKIEFSQYLFFMTRPAYLRLGLRSSYVKIGDHVFFKKWVA